MVKLSSSLNGYQKMLLHDCKGFTFEESQKQLLADEELRGRDKNVEIFNQNNNANVINGSSKPNSSKKIKGGMFGPQKE